jgi:hypothetical protein
MKRLSAKPLLAAVIGFAALAAGTAAHARPDVFVSIGFGGPVGYAQPAPVYAQPRTVYAQPRTVYAEPRTVYAEPRTIYAEPRTVYAEPRTVYAEPRTVYVQPYPVYAQPEPEYHGYERDRRHHRRHGAWGDADRDGVPNRFDRAPQYPYLR